MAARHSRVTIVALAALLVLPGCTGPSQPALEDEHPAPAVSGPPGPDGGETPAEFVDGPAMQVEFKGEVSHLAWPPGVTPPEHAPELPPMPDAQGVMHGQSYEVGYGRAVAADFWICAWGREWLAQRGQDEVRAAAAVTELNTLPETFYYQATLGAGGKEHWDEILQQVSLGDPTLMANHVTLNCVGIGI